MDWEKLKELEHIIEEFPNDVLLHVTKNDWSPTPEELEQFVRSTYRDVRKVVDFAKACRAFATDKYTVTDRTRKVVRYCEGGGVVTNPAAWCHTLEWELADTRHIAPEQFPIQLELRITVYKNDDESKKVC